MHENMQSKYTYTDIQNLETGQSIFISKDQKIEKKLKMRYIKVDGLVLEENKSIKIDLDKTIQLKSVNPDDKKPIKDKENEKTEETSFDDIDNLLK